MPKQKAQRRKATAPRKRVSRMIPPTVYSAWTTIGGWCLLTGMSSGATLQLDFAWGPRNAQERQARSNQCAEGFGEDRGPAAGDRETGACTAPRRRCTPVMKKGRAVREHSAGPSGRSIVQTTHALH